MVRIMLHYILQTVSLVYLQHTTGAVVTLSDANCYQWVWEKYAPCVLYVQTLAPVLFPTSTSQKLKHNIKWIVAYYIFD